MINLWASAKSRVDLLKINEAVIYAYNVEKAAAVDAGEKTTTYIYAFQPDSVKVLDFESDHEEFFINDLGFAVTGYMSSTDSGVTTVPALDEGMESFIDSAGAGRKGRALHWTSSAMFGKWSFFGTWICEEGSPCDLSTMDSVVFYARGTGVISIAFETLGASILLPKRPTICSATART